MRCVNGRFSSCGTACPTTCQNLRRPPEVCAAVCVAGCVCNPGYVRRNRNSNVCVRSRNCIRRYG
ncbi:unnamed protein product [Medioppia subpectinata]|uniref:TIL domain-containing protein n=1 Tax=Medioppia subpectinata TaxID=1979941 RepID=A0A7R9Q427_9ACAR|nr:unnamed protein product [Medioppia subpectinata]CAG2111091.1 unnamed protein product [Medioppia subpectinata]